MGAPTVLTYGSEDQRRRYLRPLFAGQDVWCQLFSEPGAGSDVASLSTRAVRDGDEWVVNGQKVWTSLAHKARYGLLITRSDPAVPKHAGLTYFVLDMHAPGVAVRPLRQLTGEAEFNEIFLDDVRIPDTERLGEVGGGWKVVTTTLMFERFNTGESPPRGGGAIGVALREWSKRGDTTSPACARLARPARPLLDRLRGASADQPPRRARSARRVSRGPKARWASSRWPSVNQAVLALSLDLTGAHGMLYPGGYALTRPETMGFDLDADAGKAFLRTQANSIEGGTSDIMRNILGERVLGLPAEPRADKNIPWTEVPRS